MAVSKDINCVIEYKKGDLNSKALEKFYKNLEKHSVTVGIHSDAGSKQVGNNGFTLIQNACKQEFGDTQIVEKSRRFKSPYTGKWFYLKAGTEIETPARPFVRIFNNKKEKQAITEAFKNQVDIHLKNNNAEAVYDGVGYLAKWRMRERIDGHEIKPKNADMTKEYKGSNTPLYLKGDLYFGIESKVH